MITQSELKNVLHYSPDTGVFTWIKVHPKCPFPAGTIANSKHAKGIRICISDKYYFAHKLAVLYMTGVYPDTNVLHKNGDYYDNRASNLIIATPAESCVPRNSGKNTSGVKGVNWSKSSKKWEARVMVNGKRKCIGVFADLEEAKLARAKYEPKNIKQDSP
jgi:hypothetical protein